MKCLLLLGICLLLAACNQVEDEAKKLALDAADYGYSCRELGKTLEQCKIDLRKVLMMPLGTAQ